MDMGASGLAWVFPLVGNMSILIYVLRMSAACKQSLEQEILNLNQLVYNPRSLHLQWTPLKLEIIDISHQAVVIPPQQPVYSYNDTIDRIATFIFDHPIPRT
jgi:hypothetical protein